jgi:stage II sporulation protein R
MKLKKWELALLIALAVTFLCAAAGAGLSREQVDLSEKLIRLHVVANSDTEADQVLKLRVRDAIVNDLSGFLNGVTDRGAALKLIGNSLDAISGKASAVVRAEGYDYPVSAKLAVEDFPTREYDSFSLPAGKYTALRIVIGSGQGHNWWCVVFPPLCTTAAMNDAEALKILTDEEKDLIKQDKPRYVIKFKSIEIIDKIRAWLKI